MAKDKKVPLYEQYRDRSLECMRSADVLYESELLQNAHEQAAMAVELILKSAILKAGGSPPKKGTKGHDFDRLSRIPCKGGPFSGKNKLLTAINSNRYILVSWHTIYSAWSPSDRYEQLELERDDIADLLEDYRKVWAWIKNKFVE